MSEEDDLELAIDSILTFDSLRAIVLLIVLFFAWRYYKIYEKTKQNVVLKSEAEIEKKNSANYVVKVFEYLLIINGVLGIFVIASGLTEAYANIPEISSRSGWMAYTIFVYTWILFNFVASIVLSIRLKKNQTKHTISLVLAFLYLSFFLGFLNIFIYMNSGFSNYLGLRYSAEREMYFRQLIKGLFLVPWILYFKYSKKIKTEYL